MRTKAKINTERRGKGTARILLISLGNTSWIESKVKGSGKLPSVFPTLKSFPLREYFTNLTPIDLTTLNQGKEQAPSAPSPHESNNEHSLETSPGKKFC